MSESDARVKDLQEHRAYYPALANKAYFNFGGQGVLPKQSVSAIFCSYDYVQTNGPFSTKMFEWMEDEANKTKDAVAGELGAERRSIAMTPSVTDGCNIVMWGFNWQPGDHLLLSDCEHPSIVAIAEQLAKRFGVEVSLVPLVDEAVDPVQAIKDNLKPTTKLVAISHVLWNTGRLLPIKEIGAVCRAQGVKLLVDGAQSAGVLPLNMSDLDVDFYAVTGHKWFCGPEGVGALYIRPQLIGELLPTYVGWRAHETRDDASRFEISTAPFPLYAGLRESIAMHNEWAPAAERYKQIQANVDYLRSKIKALPGAELFWSGAAGGLVTFAIAGKSPRELVKRLEAERVMVRTIPYPDALRASVHYLTNRREMDRLVDALSS